MTKIKTFANFANYSAGHLEPLPKQDENTGAVYAGQTRLLGGLRDTILIPADRVSDKENGKRYEIVVFKSNGEPIHMGMAGYGQFDDDPKHIWMFFKGGPLEKEVSFNAMPDETKEGEKPTFFSLRQKAVKADNRSANGGF